MNDQQVMRLHFNAVNSPVKYRHIWADDYYTRLHYLNEIGLYITGVELSNPKKLFN